MQQEQQQMVGQSVVVNHTQPTPGIPQEARIINMTGSTSPVDGGDSDWKILQSSLIEGRNKNSSSQSVGSKSARSKNSVSSRGSKGKRNHEKSSRNKKSSRSSKRKSRRNQEDTDFSDPSDYYSSD